MPLSPLRRARRAACAVAALALALLAPARAQTPPITIPVIVSQTGAAAAPGNDQAAALQAYEKLVNRTGGIRGTPVHFQIYDDQSTPQVALQLTATILAQKPQVVIGSTLSPATTAMLPSFANGPVLMALTPLIYPAKGAYVFATLPLPIHLEAVMFRYMRERGWTKVAFLRTNDVSGQDNARAIDAALALPENKPMTPTATQLFNPQDLNITAQISALKASSPQVLFTLATGAPFGLVMRSLGDAGFDVPTFTGATNLAPAFIERFKAYVPAGGLYSAYPSYAKRDFPPSDPLRATIDEFYATLEADGLRPGAAHAFAWDAAKIVVAALRTLGPRATAAQIHDWIENLHDFPGALGMYDYRTGDQHGLDDRSLYIVRYDPTAPGGLTIVSGAGGAALHR